MPYLVTITSKRQLTVPSLVFKKLGFLKGDKLLAEENKGGLLLKKASSLIDKIAASVDVSKRLRNINPDDAVLRAKKTRFAKDK